MSKRPFSLALRLSCLCMTPAPAPAADDWVLGMEELDRLDLLPRFKRSTKAASVSSHDRTGLDLVQIVLPRVER